MGFKVIIDRTYCIFASGSVITEYTEWNPASSMANNIKSFASFLLEFTDSSPNLKLDGCSLEVKVKINSIHELKLLTRAVLLELNKNDPHPFKMSQELIGKRGWTFRFNKMKLHLLTFSSCYPTNHPRTNYGQKHTYFLFQPHHSFERRRDESGLIPENQKKLIRERFFQAGMGYDIELAKSDFTASKFVKPLNYGDVLIKWWLED